jgi:SAM-dependent methyltransferase
MDATNQTDDEQTRLWNGPAGRAWVEAQELLDRVLEPFERLLMDAVAAGAGTEVLDVGCGTGSTTLAAARLLRGKGHAIGIDISNPMIDTARARAERERSQASFIVADAQTYAFQPGRFDMAISRFGVMFFQDSVAAFANLRAATRKGGELRFAVWRSASENPFMTTAEAAAAPLVPDLPVRRPQGPGQFAFADQRRVQGILKQSGWNEIEIRPFDVTCTLPEPELVRYFTHLGPLGRALRDADTETRAQVIQKVRPAFDPYVHGTEVRFTAACWDVTARAP